MNFFATAPSGIEPLVAEELRAIGAEEVKESPGGASFSGSLETAYRACLWSRTPSRILLPLASFPATGGDELYAAVREIPWEEHVSADGSIAVDAAVSSSALTHSHYAALRVKDAVVDRFREMSGARPSVDTARPDLRIYLHLRRDRATVGIDLSGESLHRRGYRTEGAEAPLRENLAAAILLYSKWKQVAESGGAFLDPMCGSGTLAIEAAMIAGDVAPGLLRERFGFLGWKGHDAALWERLKGEAEERRLQGGERIPGIFGYDRDPKALSAAAGNAARAGLADRISFARKDATELAPPPGAAPGLLAVNPPYGERLGAAKELVELYSSFGRRLQQFEGWKGAVFTGNVDLGFHIPLLPRRVRTLWNGPIECRLLHFDIERRFFIDRDSRPQRPLSSGGEMFANRLRKNMKALGSWARREGVSCWRLYDADMPEYAVAVDLYSDWNPAEGTQPDQAQRWLHVQEYEAPKTVDEKKAALRLADIMAALPVATGVDDANIFLKTRRRQKGRSQYEKVGETKEFHQVMEGGLRFLVNFTDYLDTGLFLDHRATRAMIGGMAAGKSFLNLFAYTGAATVHAAAGGAASTVTVDMSATYLEWAKRNMALNRLDSSRHRFIQEDCLEWLERERGRYDLIFLDPPTFSTSKRMRETLDIQRDHVRLIRSAARLLAPGGELIFSNNFRKFRMDADSLPGLRMEDITRRTIPPDFQGNPRIHNCWLIRRD
ncbi:MAG TPA: bifunctional 23S rRNA (guanine(2069)-N(7))-methyltransferase RlmK/23S rRNA (guanine(2445)-N(2))-methyltransferase RlmL [Verrucomicrobiae bacterium]|nr:bifunctional 23S rRNA (guanine(2069)-N(7))-methyltransferase RlmK/23S rRNA (guanine(2445)-N(2))-methyltransferase RlmL [Verrucomicrobiae bacterium]